MSDDWINFFFFFFVVGGGGGGGMATWLWHGRHIDFVSPLPVVDLD